MKKIGILLALFFALFPLSISAADLSQIQEELTVVDRAADEMEAEMGFSDLLQEILTGAFDFTFSDWKEKAEELALGEFRLQEKLLMQLVIVVILSAILKQFSESFQGKQVGEMAFYLCYMVLVVVILDAFRVISAVVVERMNGICGVFGAMLPIFLLLSAAKGNLMEGALMGPTIMGGSAALTVAVTKIIVPAILLAVSLELADHVSEKPILGKFAELLRQCISWGMKGAAMVFMFLLSLQKIGGDAIGGLAVRTAKSTIRSVPVVGDIMGGAVETAAAAAGALRSGTLVAAAVFLLLLCIPLVIKLLVIMLVFRLTAAAAEFICEERLVECISAAGEYTGLLLGVVFLGEGMFLFSALLLLGGL